MDFHLHTLDVTLPLNGGQTLPLTGNLIQIISAEGDVDLGLDQSVSAQRVGAGFKYRTPQGAYFKQVTIQNRSTWINLVRLVYGVGDFSFDRFALPGVREMNTSGFGVLNCPNAAATLLTDAESGRRGTYLRALPANTGDLFIVDSAYVAAGNGILLRPGEAIFLDVAAALYARNDSGAAQKLYRANFYN